MDLLSPKTIKELLAKHGAAPLKRMGQNFLISKDVLQKIMEAADLDREDTVLEIGPGLGTLTQELASRAKKVIAIEKDRKFVEILKETMKEYKNVKIIQGDVLKSEITSSGVIPAKAGIQKTGSRIKSGMTKTNYKVVANLPYYITSPVIRKFLETANKPKEMIFMVQKEVAQRICANPPDMSLLAVSVQFYAVPKIINYISKGSFWPQPKVDSAILRLTPKATQIREWHTDDTDKLFMIVRAGFSSPRKQLAGNLTKGLKIERHIIEDMLKKADIESSRRAETLSVEEWIKLVRLSLKKEMV